MIIIQVQTRLRGIKDEETKKWKLVPSKVWTTLTEYDEFDDEEDIQAYLKHQIDVNSKIMKSTFEETEKYFRLKEIIRETDDE
jgi:inorganic pyrophosphatase